MKRLDTNLSIPLALALAAGLTVGCDQGADPTAEVVEEGAPRSAQDREIPGMSSEDDLDPITAQRYIDSVHVGYELDANGRVAEAARTETFEAESKVYVSMEATDAPTGSVVRLNVLDDETDRPVWTEEIEVPAGRSFVNFSIDAGELAAGTYRAEVVIGDEAVAKQDFTVREQRA